MKEWFESMRKGFLVSCLSYRLWNVSLNDILMSTTYKLKTENLQYKFENYILISEI